MKYQVLIGKPSDRSEYRPGDHTVTVDAASELDAAYQAGITLALGRPASRLRALVVKSVRSEAEAAAS